MSEKVTLLTSIPSAEKAEAPKGSLKLLSSTPTEKKEEAPKVSLLSQTGLATRKEAPNESSGKLSLLSSQPSKSEPIKLPQTQTEPVVESAAAQHATAAASETSASEAVAEEPAGTSTFQVVTFGSLVLGVLLVVVAAVFFLKNNGKKAKKPSTVIGKAPGVVKSSPVKEPAPAPATPVAVEASAPVAEAAPAEQPVPVAEATPVEQPAPSPPPIAAGNPDDPIIQFLNGEAEASEIPAEPEEAVVQSTSRAAPPPKPKRSGLTPPPKPGIAKKQEAPNAPTRVKAPAKPKKRL